MERNPFSYFTLSPSPSEPGREAFTAGYSSSLCNDALLLLLLLLQPTPAVGWRRKKKESIVANGATTFFAGNDGSGGCSSSVFFPLIFGNQAGQLRENAVRSPPATMIKSGGERRRV